MTPVTTQNGWLIRPDGSRWTVRRPTPGAVISRHKDKSKAIYEAQLLVQLDPPGHIVIQDERGRPTRRLVYDGDGTERIEDLEVASDGPTQPRRPRPPAVRERA